MFLIRGTQSSRLPAFDKILKSMYLYRKAAGHRRKGMERVNFIHHRGRQILYLNFSGCSSKEVLSTIIEAKRIIRIQPRESVLTLTDVTGARYNLEVTQAIKEFTNGNKIFVKAGAVVGLDGLKRIVYDAVIRFSGRNLPAFDDIEKAKDWLADQ
jgi:hypothetical protein